MGGEIVDFGAFEYSNTFRRFEAKKVGIGSEVVIVSSPTPSQDKTYCMKFPEDKLNNTWQSFITWSDSNDITFGCYVYFDRLPPDEDNIDFVQIINSTPSNICGLSVRRTDASNHYLTILDATNSEVGSTANPFTVNTWHRVEFTFQRADPSDVVVHVDGVEVLNESGVDCTDAVGGDLRVYLRGQQGPGDPLEFPTVTYISSYYLKTGGTGGASDFIGDWEVYRYDVNKTGATPDTGDDLDGGAWTDLSDDSDTAEAQYNAGHSGYCLTNDSPNDGPSGDLTVQNDLLAGKWTWSLNGTTTSGDTWVRYGYSNGSTDIITTETTTATRTFNPWNIVHDRYKASNNRCPKITDWFCIGFKHNGGSGSVYTKEAFCFAMYQAPIVTDSTTTIHIKGGDIKGATIV